MINPPLSFSFPSSCSVLNFLVQREKGRGEALRFTVNAGSRFLVDPSSVKPGDTKTLFRFGDEKLLMRRIVLALSLAASMLVLTGSPVEAGPNNYMAPWAKLSPEEKAVLQPLQQTWDKLHYKQRERLLRVLAFYPTMSALEKERFSSRLLQWSTLSRGQRDLVRMRYLEFSRLPKGTPVRS